MFLPKNDISEVVLQQRNQKKELSKALFKNQTKLTQVQQQMRFLTQPLNTDYIDECERLDDEIDKLGRICHAMLNEIEKIKRSNQPTVEIRQPIRPAPPPPPLRPPRMKPQNLSPIPAAASLAAMSPSLQHAHSPTSPSKPQEHQQPKIVDTNDGSGPHVSEQPWQCSMCTFQNHPLLNKCECCENVRVLPGTVRIVPSRPPPPLSLGSRSAPQTPGTPLTGISGSQSARVLTLPSDYIRSGVANSSSEGNMQQFVGDAII